MICKHCKQEVASFKSYRKVIESREVRIIDNEPYSQDGFCIEHPAGKPSYEFRCGSCGGDLNDKYRECLMLLTRGGIK